PPVQNRIQTMKTEDLPARLRRSTPAFLKGVLQQDQLVAWYKLSNGLVLAFWSDVTNTPLPQFDVVNFPADAFLVQTVRVPDPREKDSGAKAFFSLLDLRELPEWKTSDIKKLP